MSDQPSKHGHQHGPEGPDPIRYANYHCIVRRQNQLVITGSPSMVFSCTRHMDGYRLIDIEAGVVEPSSTDIEIELTNNTQAVTMTSSPLVIPGGDVFSDLDAASPVASGDDAIVSHGDQLWINVVDAGDGGAMGLEVILVFV